MSIKLLVFDFDNTLCRYNFAVSVYSNSLMYPGKSYGQVAEILLETKKKEEVLSELFCNEKFISYLKQLIIKKKIRCAIASYGFKDAIYPVLLKYNLFSLFSEIYTPRDAGLEDGNDYTYVLSGKNFFLNRFMKKYKVINPSYVMLLDDATANINYAKKYNYNTVHSAKSGLTNHDAQLIQKFVDTPIQ